MARMALPSETKRPSALVDTRVIYCGDNLEQLKKLPNGCIDLIYLEGELALKERWYPIQVKQRDKVGRPDVDSFEAMMMRKDCDKAWL